MHFPGGCVTPLSVLSACILARRLFEYYYSDASTRTFGTVLGLVTPIWWCLPIPSWFQVENFLFFFGGQNIVKGGWCYERTLRHTEVRRWAWRANVKKYNTCMSRINADLEPRMSDSENIGRAPQKLCKTKFRMKLKRRFQDLIE